MQNRAEHETKQNKTKQCLPSLSPFPYNATTTITTTTTTTNISSSSYPLNTSNTTNNMPLTEEHHAPSFFDALLCEEQQHTFDDSDSDSGDTHSNNNDPTLVNPPSILVDNNDLFWEHDDLLSLISKETVTHAHFCSHTTLFEGPRHDAVRWIRKVCAFYGFTALTTVLAVNYFDKFVTTLRFQTDKPWMTQLAAVASLSLAAKMEEIHVPLLLDLQVEEPRFVFEAKTIQRMELLVLSNLDWKMNPVTPISFFEHIVRRLGLKTPLHWEFLWRCERVLLCLIADSTVMSYLPSTLAAATMIHVIKETEPFNATEYINQLMDLLKISEEQVNECYKLILQLLVLNEGIYNLCRKRKQLYEEPGSPGGVIDASFSSDSSNDSWTVASSASLSLEPVFKRSKAQDPQMRLASVNRASIDVLNSPR